MATLLRLDASHAAADRRCVVGVSVSSKCTHVGAAMVTAHGRGLEAQASLSGVASTALARETTTLFTRLARDDSCPTGSLAQLRAQLAETQASLVTGLLGSLGTAADAVLAVGVDDPGLWNLDASQSRGFLGLCDAARLAETTGINVVDAFPARDLAQGGLGGPITAVAQWVLLRHPRSSRVLLDLGRTVRMTYLPATAVDRDGSRILAFDVGPGTRLLDLLAERLTEGEHRFDPGGRLAVQGRRIEPLVAHWLADPYFDRPLPRWHPRGVRPERFLADSLQMAVDSGWSVRDLLCSATHFIAETVKLTLCRRLPEDIPIDEMVLTGGGQHNGLLLRGLASAVQLPLVRIDELGVPEGTLGPAAVAVLALLHLDQVAANRTAVTKTESPGPLGRITPGSARSWRRLMQTDAGSGPPARQPLRSAS